MHQRWIAAGLAAMLGAMTAAPATASAATPGVLKQFSTELADMVERVMPSVVVIRTEATSYVHGYDMFFGRRLAIPHRSSGQGSGVVFDERGYILTSRHVVAGAQQIEVIFSDETVFEATIAGADANTDLAVLKITDLRGRKVKAAPMGDSDRLRVGEIVVAVGSPFSLSSSVTMGIVSQKGRNVGVLPFEDFIQTDAPINPGNSGGPLVDLDGRVVGINAVIQTSGAAPGSIGIGFAVPANLAKRVAESLIRTGRFDRPWIGIRPSEQPHKDGGIIVQSVFRGTPAEKAGLQPGDVLTRAGGQPIHSFSDLLRIVYGAPEGKPIAFTLRRDGQAREIAFPATPMPNFDPREGE